MEIHIPEPAGSGSRYGGAMPNARIQDQVEALAREFAARVTRVVAQSIAEEVEAALSRHVRTGEAAPAAAPASAGRGRRASASRRRAGSVERWVPDRSARCVPNFVIEATGLRTKQEIVARFGEHAIFEKGQPAPAPLRAGAAND
jgi:hypothetical protein